MIQFKFLKISLLTCREYNFGDKRGNNMNAATLAQESAVCGFKPGDSEK